MRGSDDSLVRIGRAPRADALSEAQVLAELERRLFGRDIEPVRLSRYVLLERLGGGAFGSVYLGYDPQLDRRVAIKLLHGAGASADERDRAQARLVDEAKALARLSHPNVVAVYDVGTFDATQPSAAQIVAAHAGGMRGPGVFVVMELVAGETLSEWLVRTRPTRRQILDAFSQAGEGLAAAHAAGIVHRDFKPDNVLVGADRRVRIADFGIAASAEHDEERSPLEIAGTPAYAAPEQLAGAAPDARADQYAFAVALYEALSGIRPTPHVSDTTRPESSATPTQVVIASDVRLPKWLRAALVRGLAAAPEARHPDMRALLGALRKGERAWRPAAALLGLVGVAALATWRAAGAGELDCHSGRERFAGAWDAEVSDAIRARFTSTGAPGAEQIWTAVAKTLDDRVDAWDAQSHELCRADAADGAASVRAERLRCLARDVQRVSGLTQLFREADAMIVSRAVESVHELPAIGPCAGPGDHDPLDAADRDEATAIAGELVRADELGRAGRFDAALAIAVAARQRARAIDDPATIAAAEIALGAAYQRAGDYAAAETTLRAALSSAERAGDDELPVRAMAELVRALTEQGRLDAAEGVAVVAEARVARGDVGDAAVARLLYQTGILRTSEGRHELAATQLERGRVLAEQLYGPDHPYVAQFHNTLGNAYKDAGRFADALVELEIGLEQHRRLLGPSHPMVALAFNNIANVRWKQGELAQAVALYRKAAEITDAWFPAGHPNLSAIDGNLAGALQHLGHDAEALPRFDRAIELRRRAGHGNGEVASLLHGRAFANLALRRYDDARADLLASLELRLRERGPEHPDTARSLDALGEVESLRGRLDEALDLHGRALRIRRARFGDDDVEISISQMTTADTLERMGRLAEAESLRVAALEQRTRRLGAHALETAWATAALGRSRLAAGDVAAALSLLRTAHARLVRRLGPGHIMLVDVLRALAAAELAGGDRERARSSARAALDILTSTPGVELARFTDVTAMVAATEQRQR